MLVAVFRSGGSMATELAPLGLQPLCQTKFGHMIPVCSWSIPHPSPSLHRERERERGRESGRQMQTMIGIQHLQYLIVSFNILLHIITFDTEGIDRSQFRYIEVSTGSGTLFIFILEKTKGLTCPG